MVTEWLVNGMFKDEPQPDEAAKRVVQELGSRALTVFHARHISTEKALAMGLKVTALESDRKPQEAVLTVRHACVHTLNDTPALKITDCHVAIPEGKWVDSGRKSDGGFCSARCYANYHVLELADKANLLRRGTPPPNEL
jgi:hypothetical protein